MTTRRNRLIPSVNRYLTPANSGAAWDLDPGIGGDLNDRELFEPANGPVQPMAARLSGVVNYPPTFRGAADRCWVQEKLESKRGRLSVNKGTREARSSRVVVQLNRFRTAKSLPMRRPSGGASVVVGDVNNDHMAKGCRTVRFGQQRSSLSLEASK